MPQGWTDGADRYPGTAHPRQVALSAQTQTLSLQRVLVLHIDLRNSEVAR